MMGSRLPLPPARIPWEGQSLGVEVLGQGLLALGQVVHQPLETVRQTVHVGRLHNVGRLGHFHHEPLELCVHTVKALRVLW